MQIHSIERHLFTSFYICYLGLTNVLLRILQLNRASFPSIPRETDFAFLEKSFSVLSEDVAEK